MDAATVPTAFLGRADGNSGATVYVNLSGALPGVDCLGANRVAGAPMTTQAWHHVVFAHPRPGKLIDAKLCIDSNVVGLQHPARSGSNPGDRVT